MPKAVLVDLLKCIGCRSCQVACKQWNNLPATATTFTNTRDNPPALGRTTWTRVEHKFIEYGSAVAYRFVKRQCMHCLDPACVEACFMKVLKKTPEGPVIVASDKCIGCYYCQVACPFEIPQYEWTSGVPRVQKCRFCYEPGGAYDRLGQGLKPACVQACTTGALKFGERAELLAEAQRRINTDPRYVRHIYGEEDQGGTSWLYISDVPFAELGFAGRSGISSFWKRLHGLKTG
ncbi:MAG: 4Fe-4S dicluster domain-containing protein [Bacillota bacterium]|nr:4Fe-4S dicluster domain-containing protein [Thermoanaerobacteraceae bacterium]